MNSTPDLPPPMPKPLAGGLMRPINNKPGGLPWIVPIILAGLLAVFLTLSVLGINISTKPTPTPSHSTVSVCSTYSSYSDYNDSSITVCS